MKWDETQASQIIYIERDISRVMQLRILKTKALTIMVMMFIPFLLILLSPDGSTTTKGEWILEELVASPIASVGMFGSARSGLLSAQGATQLDISDCNINPSSTNYGWMKFLAMGQFDTWQEAGYNDHINESSIFTNVKLFFAGGYQYSYIPEGFFSFGFVTPSWYESVPFLDGLKSWPVLRDDGVNKNGSIWHNSTLYPWDQGRTKSVEWDVTSLFAWNYSLLTSPNLYVMWYTKENRSSQFINYLGFKIETSVWIDQGSTDTGTYIATNISGLIWLLIVFLPSILLNTVFPKIGYAFGMILMLVIFTVTQDNFLIVTLIGFIGIGALLMKGD